MKNYAIQCQFSTPYLASESITYLDGILGEISFHRNVNNMVENPAKMAQDNLPLEKTFNGPDDFIYHASAMLLCGESVSPKKKSIIATYAYNYTRLRNLEKFQDTVKFATSGNVITIKKNIDNLMLDYREYNVNTGWFTFRGELNAVMDLLSDAPNLGVKRNYNFGKVDKYSFYELDEDRSFISKNGMLLSRIPTGFQSGSNLVNDIPMSMFTRAHTAYRTPYCPRFGAKMDYCVVPDRHIYRDEEVRRMLGVRNDNFIDELEFE